MGPETARWGGGLPREGVVAENFVLSLESLSPLGFEERNLGCPGNFAGTVPDPWGCSKSFVQKKFVRIFRSLNKVLKSESKSDYVILAAPVLVIVVGLCALVGFVQVEMG